MFKRIDKRRRRQEEEEELGIDDELKQVLGIQDTDSEESDSGSDDGESDDDGEGNEDAGLSGSHFEGSDAEDEGEDEDEDASKSMPLFLLRLTIEQAMKEPILPAPDDPHLNFCVLCPQKTLRSEMTVKVHRSSNAHRRRLAQFIQHSKNFDQTELALSVIDGHMQPQASVFVNPSTEGKSKRALKKEASKALRKANREKAKAKAKAKPKKQASEQSKMSVDPPTTAIGNAASLSRKKRREGKSDTSASKPTNTGEPATPPAMIVESPPKKKRRVKAEGRTLEKSNDKEVAEELKPSKPTSPPGVAVSIKTIARSASHRAKAALAQSRKAKS